MWGGANRASSASNSVLLLWQDFSLLVSDPSKILEDIAIKWFLCVSQRAGESWSCAMHLDRCFTVLSCEAVSRDIELGNLDILVLGDGRGRWVEKQEE